MDGAREHGATPRHHGAIAGWADLIGPPAPESRRSAMLAHLGGLAAVTAISGYLWWRIGFTLPRGGADLAAALALIAFEALPLIGLGARMITIWNTDAPRPPALPADPPLTAVLIPTFDEPAEVIAPTIAAAVALEPDHQTWVLDDGDRAWVREMCADLGARYVSREEHAHAKAGNLNHALALMASEAASGAPEIEVIAVLDADHVPLPAFLRATLGWFTDPGIALVQGPQSFYNNGAYDDDGVNGEQGLFFNVLMPARHHRDAGPFWCGSTALVRVSALREVGGVATETIVEDLHTTLRLIKAGWRTVYHHQTLALGLAPATAGQYLLQRRRWGLGAMQVLSQERLWAAKRWLSWRNYYEYIAGTLWWLEGAATLALLGIPMALLLSGAETSTAGPLAFSAAFAAMFAVRLWGARRLYRHQLSLPHALALRILRVPVGLSCLWWLVTRRTLHFQVTPKSGAAQRLTGQVPRVLIAMLVVLAAALGYAAAGLAGLVPWRASPGATVASGSWLLIAALVVALGARRITAAEFATSRRNAHRFPVTAPVTIDGRAAVLADVSVGGLRAHLLSEAQIEHGVVAVSLPGLENLDMATVRSFTADGGQSREISLRIQPGDWASMGALSRWLFHTPPGAVIGLPAGVPAVACAPPARWLATRHERAASARVRVPVPAGD